MIQSDFEMTVGRATKYLPDERVSHFWDRDEELAKAYSQRLRLSDEQPAWDMYMVYDRDAEWNDAPPMPTYWMTKLDLEQGHPFNGEELATEINKIRAQPKK